MGSLSIPKKEGVNQLVPWIKSLQEFQLDSHFETSILGRAYNYLHSIDISQVEKESIKASIIGSSVYEVEFNLENDSISFFCTCPHNKSCKHIAAVMLKIMDINF